MIYNIEYKMLCIGCWKKKFLKHQMQKFELQNKLCLNNLLIKNPPYILYIKIELCKMWISFVFYCYQKKRHLKNVKTCTIFFEKLFIYTNVG